MFSGIIEACLPCLRVEEQKGLFRVFFKKPSFFQDIKEGDSVCVDGVCLTVETLASEEMSFTLAFETLKKTQWKEADLKNKKFNLERSLSLNSALGGHWVTGHVDGVIEVAQASNKSGCILLELIIPEGYDTFFCEKGYIVLNGVSLTINEVQGRHLKLCLVPKTLEKTNLIEIKAGDFLNFEIDYFSRLVVNSLKNEMKKRERNEI